jgi:HlyD family secretion protein
MSLPPRKVILIAVAVIALLAGLLVIALGNGPMAGRPVTIATAEVADLSPQIFGIGTIEARRAYVIGPVAASRVTRVLVDHGDQVKAGQLLAELDPIDLDERLNSAASAIQRAISAVQGTEAQLRETTSRSTLADASATRFSELRQKGFVSQEAADLKRHEANAAAAARQSAQAALDAAHRDVARLESDRAGIGRQRAQLRLVSPIDGLITSREAEPGSTVVAGQAVLRLINPDSLWVKARIDQGRAAGIRVGQPAHIVLRSQPQASLAGKVARIEVNSDSVTEERLVEITFDTPPPGLSVGEMAEVTIQLPTAQAVLAVPTAAIRRVGQLAGVWRVENGKSAFAPVRTGIQTLDGRTQVLEGLRQGDSVIHHSLQEVGAGVRVRVVDSLAVSANATGP